MFRLLRIKTVQTCHRVGVFETRGAKPAIGKPSLKLGEQKTVTELASLKLEEQKPATELASLKLEEQKPATGLASLKLGEQKTVTELALF